MDRGNDSVLPARGQPVSLLENHAALLAWIFRPFINNPIVDKPFYRSFIKGLSTVINVYQPFISRLSTMRTPQRQTRMALS